MKKTLLLLLVSLNLAFGQTPTPTPVGPGSGVFVWISLDQITVIYQKNTPGVFRCEYYNSVSDVIGNPLTATPVPNTSFVKMELAKENTP